jgi:ribosomal protein S18
VKLLDKGKCQFCGAVLQNGVFECLEIYNNRFELLDFDNTTYHIPRFLSVDAHALQHPEIHGRWSNHFHLTRFHLILEKKVKLDYKKSPLLSNFLNEYKKSRLDEKLITPSKQKRGNITAVAIANAKTTDECVQLINNWALEIYNTWSQNHLLVFLKLQKVF